VIDNRKLSRPVPVGLVDGRPHRHPVTRDDLDALGYLVDVLGLGMLCASAGR
jgi:hypothetical protein